MAEKTTIAQQIERIIDERNKIIDHMASEWSISRSEVDTLEKIRTTIETIEYGKTIPVSVFANDQVVPAGYYDGTQRIEITDGGEGGFELINHTIEPTDDDQTILPGTIKEGADGFSSVTVKKIPQNYGKVDNLSNSANAGAILAGYEAFVLGADENGNSIATKVEGSIVSYENNQGLTVNGSTIHVSPGYYPEGASQSVSSGSVKTPSISVDGSTGIITATVDYTSGYILQGNKTNTLPLDYIEGGTFAPSKDSATTIVRANTYTLGDIVIDKIPDKYIDTSESIGVAATAAQIIKGTVAYVNGERLEGQLEEFSTSGEHILWAGTKEYTIPVGAVNGGTVKILTETKEIEQITKEEQHITPTGNNVITKVIVPSVSSYLDGKVDIAPELVVEGSSYVDENGDVQSGTMQIRTGDFEWDYEVYDKFPIPAGAYIDQGEGGNEVQGTYQHWYLPNKEYLAWEQENIYTSINGHFYLKDEWSSDLNSAFGPAVAEVGFLSVYKFPIIGNGYITEMNSYGLSISEPIGGSGDNDDQENAIQAYELFLKNGTLYLACDRSNTSPDSVYAWIYEYKYTLPGGTGAYVVMDGLAEALAAI